MRKTTIFSIFLVLGLVSAGAAFAADVITPRDQNNPDVTLLSNESHRNAYVVGGSVTVDSAITGDLVVAGRTVAVGGQVEQDITAAGKTVDIRNTVGGDVRAAAGDIVIASKIGGDLVVAGGTVAVTDKAEIMGDVLVAGGQVSIDGPVHGSVRIAGGSVWVNTTIGGPVTVSGNDLTFGPHAVVASPVRYKGGSPAVMQTGSKVSSVEFTNAKPSNLSGKFKAAVTGAAMVYTIALILAGLLLIRFKKTTVEEALTEVSASPWKNMGFGILGILVFAILIPVCFFALVGFYIGIVVALWFLLMLAVAYLVATIVLGALIVRFLTRSVQSVVDWQAVLIGVVMWVLLSFIPFIGFIFTALFFCMVFGAMLMMVKSRLSSQTVR